MKAPEIKTQFLDPTGDAAIARADRSYGQEWRRVPVGDPDDFSLQPTTVEQVNGIVGGHQTGVETIGSIQAELARLNLLRRSKQIPRADYNAQKQELKATLGRLRFKPF